MAGFNHYAKLKRILADEPEGWYIRRIDKPTKATNFRGETTYFEHYYRLYNANDSEIKYGKFQQIELLARALGMDYTELPIID